MPAKSSSVVAIGSIFLDCKRFCLNSLRDPEEDHARFYHGGVGRNIAENLGWLGLEVEMITLLSPGDIGQLVAERLNRAGVKLTARCVEGGIGSFTATLDRDGALLRSTVVFPPAELLDWNFVSQHQESLARAKYVIVEMGLSLNLLERLFEETSRKGTAVCGIPTRLNEAVPQLGLIRFLDCLVVNQYEASAILDMPIETSFDAIRAVEQFQRCGVTVVAITLGPAGVVAANGQQAPTLYPAPEARVLDTTGAGDAFVAGLIAGLVTEKSFDDGVGLGLAHARRTVETLETVRDEPAHIF